MAAGAASDELGLLAASARRSIDDLHDAIRGVKVADGERGARVLEVTSFALDELRKRVADAEKRWADAKDEPDRRAALLKARRVNISVLELHEAATPWIEGARQATLGLGLVYLIDEMVAGLLKAGADVVGAPSARYMYSTLRDLRRLLTEALGVPFPDGPTAIVVAYPIHEPDSLFLHLIIAHELGHSVVPAKGLIQTVRSKDPDPDETKKLLAGVADAYKAAEGGTPAMASVQAAAMLKSWLTELLCDALALAFLGPSFLFATAAFSTPFEQDGSTSHPPFPLRIKLLLDQLKALGSLELAREAAPKTLAWIEGRTTSTGATRPYLADLAAVVERLEPFIHETVGDQLGSDVFAVAPDELGAIDLLLEHDVLPAQLPGGAPADHRAIVFAGWRRAFARHGDDPTALASILADKAFQRFLTKALEMSTVLKVWRAP